MKSIRMVLCAFVGIFGFGGMVWAESTPVGVVKVEMNTPDCRRLIPGIFARSANYVEGVDVHGREVVSASGDGSANVKSMLDWLPKVVSFDLQFDISKLAPKLADKLDEIGVGFGKGATSGGADVPLFYSQSSSARGNQIVEPLSGQEQAELSNLDKNIEALELYEDELVWTRRAIAGNSVEMAQRLVLLQDERKKINARIAEQEKVLLGEKQRVISATGGSAEKEEGMLLLRKRQLKKAEARYYYGEAYLRLQRALMKNSDAQERVKQAMALKDKAEEEGQENALLVNEQALQKTRTKLEHLRTARNGLVAKGGISNSQTNRVQENKAGAEASEEQLPYGIDIHAIGSAMKVEYDMAQGLLLLNGQPLEPAEITNLIRQCKNISKEKSSS